MWASPFEVILIIILISCYFIPTIIAMTKGKKDRVAIFALNLLVGWTFVGWLIAFIWSLCSDE